MVLLARRSAAAPRRTGTGVCEERGGVAGKCVDVCEERGGIEQMEKSGASVNLAAWRFVSSDRRCVCGGRGRGGGLAGPLAGQSECLWDASCWRRYGAE